MSILVIPTVELTRPPVRANQTMSKPIITSRITHRNHLQNRRKMTMTTMRRTQAELELHLQMVLMRILVLER